MSRREAWLSVGLVFLVALVVRIAAASLVVFPKPEDTAYYVDVAGNLVAGRGLVADVLWSYQTPPLVFPRPAFEVWLPLPSFLAALPMALFGSSFATAQWSSILMGAIVPVLAWRLAADVAAERGLAPGRARTLALGTGLTAAVSLAVVLHSTLPDSTMPFAALALAACLLMSRLVREPRGGGAADPRLLGLGVVLGLAALTRNEAAWLALAWVGLAWWSAAAPREVRARLVLVPAVVALAIFGPWAIRDWIEFGSPLPGQALANALSVTGFDIFAWNDPPTLSRYLAVGPARLLEMRIEGLGHNLGNVLLLPGAPVSVLGLLALPWLARDRAVRPVVIVSVATFLVTSLVFPISTTWGTFLHAAGPVHVLLILSALLALDAGIARLGAWRGWTRPVAWLGPMLTVSAGLLFLAALMPSFGAGSRATERQYEALSVSLVAAGVALGPSASPVITDFPIWFAEATGTPALALPDESPADVLDLAARFGARYLVLADGDRPDAHGRWPGVLDAGSEAGGSGSAAAACFSPLELPLPTDPADEGALRGARAWSIGCPGG